MIQPRLGFAYMLDDKTIMRGGYGIYYLNVVGISSSDGFGVQTTRSRRSTATARRRRADQPVPERRAVGAGLVAGLATILGRAPGFSNTDFANPYVHQFSLRLPADAAVAHDVRSLLRRLAHARAAEPVGRVQRTVAGAARSCDPSKGGNPGICNELLPNPFFQIPGFEGTARFTSPTLSRYELSRPFPQYGQITEFDRNDGKIWYNSAQFVLNKRVSDGLTLSGNYTWSKMIEENGGGNQIGGATANPTIAEVDRIVQRSAYESDRRHRITISGVYHLPFGSERSS